MLLKNLKEKTKEQVEDKLGLKDDIEKAYQHLGLLAFVCVSKFGGYPELYKPVLDIILDDINLTGFDSFRDKYSIEKISTNLSLILSNERNENLYKNIYDNERELSSKSAQNSSNEFVVQNKLGPSLTGLVNLGNTCYLNSIIQSLFVCETFAKSIIELEINETSATKLYCLNQLKKVFSCMFLTKRPTIKPTALVKNCTPTWFRFGQQQDSSEYLNFLLDNLNEQLNSPEAYSNQSKTSVIVRSSFGIQLTTKCECSKCNSKTYSIENCYYLPLSFSSDSDTKNEFLKKNTSLQTLIDNFFETEKLTSESGNSYFCTHCNSLQDASKQISFTRNDSENILPPNYLIFTLNRFVYSMTNGSVGGNNKIMEQLNYPNIIEIKTYNSEKMITEKYSLLSLVVHSGSSLHYGHYFTYMKRVNEEAYEWYLANDSSISKIDFEKLISSQSTFKDDTPYILFYKKIQEVSVQKYEFKVNSNFVEIIEQDNKVYEAEEKNRISQHRGTGTSKLVDSTKRDDDDDKDDGSNQDNSWKIGPNLIH